MVTDLVYIDNGDRPSIQREWWQT